MLAAIIEILPVVWWNSKPCFVTRARIEPRIVPLTVICCAVAPQPAQIQR